MRIIKSSLLLAPILVLALPVRAESLPSPTSETAMRTVVDLSSAEALAGASPSHPEVTVSRADGGAGIDLKIAPSQAGFPGISFTPAGGAVYDLSNTGFIEARITNTGDETALISLRIDNNGDWKENPWNGASAYLKPGATGTARIYYGISFNQPGYAIDSSRITELTIFTGKNESKERSFRLEAIEAGGKPGDKPPGNPDLARAKPKNGVILGESAPFDPTKQLVGKAGAVVVSDGAATGKSFKASFTNSGQTALFRPVRGYWDLGHYLGVTVRLENVGNTPAQPSIQLSSRGGMSDKISAADPIAPGKTADIVVPFIPATPNEIESDPEQERADVKKSWGVRDSPGAKFFSHQVNGVQITPGDSDKGTSLEIASITATIPKVEIPPWLGKRPPVDGDWTLTFEENFDGATLDSKKWGTKADNWWDQRVHFTKENILFENGFGKLRIEKKSGRHNDEPEGKLTEFATGWLDTYGKWTQRYGYFEIRLKLPTAPSMFPGFWLMPERGPAGRHRNFRTRTEDGGMEFDILEGQSMWGPYRTTFGMHWDGYAKTHKSAGSTTQYNLPDKDGFLTIGMLWTPGHVSVYSQGKKSGSWDSPRIGDTQSFLILDLLPGGFEYDALDPATLPADLVIDYVRVWQRKDLASPEDGPKP